MNRLDPLTGLRGIAAYSVLIAHAVDSAFVYSGHVSVFHAFAVRLAYFGMSLFFVLSGFVIQYNYAESFAREGILPAGYKFFVARFARLYPLYAVSIILSLPHIPVPVFSDNPAIVLAFLTLTQSWFNVELAVFPPDWSVSTEWFFYVAFIPLTVLMRWISRPVWALIVLCVLAVSSMSFVTYFYRDPLLAILQPWLQGASNIRADPWGWFTYFAPPIRLAEFVAGLLAAKAYLAMAGREPPSRGTMAIQVMAVLWCGAVVFIGPLTEPLPLQNILSNVIFVPALAPLLLCVCLSPSWFSRVLSSRPLMFLGEISYSVYVWSFFVLTMLGPTFSSPEWSTEAALNSGLKIIADIAMTTVFAYGSYLLIEVPSRRWLRKVLTPAIPQPAFAEASRQT